MSLLRENQLGCTALRPLVWDLDGNLELKPVCPRKLRKHHEKRFNLLLPLRFVFGILDRVFEVT